MRSDKHRDARRAVREPLASQPRAPFDIAISVILPVAALLGVRLLELFGMSFDAR
jgi:hypothetical protein